MYNMYVVKEVLLISHFFILYQILQRPTKYTVFPSNKGNYFAMKIC